MVKNHKKNLRHLEEREGEPQHPEEAIKGVQRRLINRIYNFKQIPKWLPCSLISFCADISASF